MAFNVQSWCRVSSSSNNAITTLQNGTFVGAPNVFTYISATDAQATIAGANYFAPVVVELNVGDLIYAVDSTDVPIQYLVSAKDNVAKTVTVTNSAPAGGDVIGTPPSTLNALARYSDASGVQIKNSTAILTDGGELTGLTFIDVGFGNVGAPSYSFTGRLTDGMWSSAANTVDFSTNGIRGFQIAASPALAVDYLSVKSAATGAIGLPIIQANGTDANVDVGILPRGTGGLSIRGATNSGSVKLWNQPNTFFAAIKAAAMAGNITWTWPVADATVAGQAIVSDTAGNLSFSGVSAQGWTNVAASPQAIAANGQYIANTAGLLTFNVPALMAQGSIVEVAGQGAGGWLIQMNAGQTANSSAGSTSVAGSLASTNRYDCIKLLCVTANTTFTVLSSSGVITNA